MVFDFVGAMFAPQPSKVSCERYRELDIARLCSLVSTGQENDKLSSTGHEIDPVTGSIVDSHLGNTLTHGPDVPPDYRAKASGS
jgi:hypothetical protein